MLRLMLHWGHYLDSDSLGFVFWTGDCCFNLMFYRLNMPLLLAVCLYRPTKFIQASQKSSWCLFAYGLQKAAKASRCLYVRGSLYLGEAKHWKVVTWSVAIRFSLWWGRDDHAVLDSLPRHEAYWCSLLLHIRGVVREQPLFPLSQQGIGMWQKEHPCFAVEAPRVRNQVCHTAELRHWMVVPAVERTVSPARSWKQGWVCTLNSHADSCLLLPHLSSVCMVPCFQQDQSCPGSDLQTLLGGGDPTAWSPSMPLWNISGSLILTAWSWFWSGRKKDLHKKWSCEQPLLWGALQHLLLLRWWPGY